jgi:photosystem II stability/assembly factor-like uncharacterized protein
MALALSHGGTNVYSNTAPSDEVVIGTTDGVVIMKREGSGWAVVDRSLSGQHIHALVHEEESGLWFAGVNKGGIHVSSDGARTWERRDAGLTETDVYSLATVKVDGHVRLFAGTEPAKLFVSEDLGVTWAEKPNLAAQSTNKWSFPAPPHVPHLKHINFAPGDPNTIFGSIEVGALLKSTDGGETWAEIPGVYADVHRTVVDPNNADHIYVTGGAGLWVTENGGDSWDNTHPRESDTGGYADQLVFKPSDPSFMVMAAGAKSPNLWREEKTARSRITRSRDSAATWERLTNGITDDMTHAIEAMALEEAGSTVQVFAANTGGTVLWSEDGGEKWSVAVSGLAPISKGGHFRGMEGQPA